MSTKVCRICNQNLDLTQFNRNYRAKDRLDSRCKSCVLQYQKELKNKVQEREYEIYELDLDSTDWQAGKPSGSIAEITRNDITWYEVRHFINRKQKTKIFYCKNNDIDDVYMNAKKYKLEFSAKNGLTRNMIRFIEIDGQKYIEVQLTQGMTMITDIKFSDIIQKYLLSVINNESKYYCRICINNHYETFHKYITGYRFTKHINGNTMDNRLCNLSEITYKELNNNRSGPKIYENTDQIIGVKQYDYFWRGYIRQNKKLYSKSFSIKKYGNEEARRLAIEYRQELNEQFNCKNRYKHDLQN